MALTVQEIYQVLYKNFNFQRRKTHFKMRTKEMKQGVKEVKKNNLSEIITSLLNLYLTKSQSGYEVCNQGMHL